MVRKGIKLGLVSEIDTDTQRFFQLYADNVHRHGTPGFSKRYFEISREVFREACEVLIVLDAEKRPISGVLSFYFRNEVLPYYAGDTPDAAKLAANDFKYWEAHEARTRTRMPRIRLRTQQDRHRFVRFQEELGLRAYPARL